MAQLTVRRRIGGAAAGAVFACSLAGLGAPPVQAATPTALTMDGSRVSGKPYKGTRSQSFTVVKQRDGSSGIRNKYSGLVLTMDKAVVSGKPYKGTRSQSFTVVKQRDGSSGIRNKYSGLALTMDKGVVSGKTYNGTRAQSFTLVKQGDGSQGIRAFYN
ncbi:RICIN domain-containing protein [Streptomyces pinistramenti]|uniref:RICIN domain-containing protein n=1 Tax=Streptomyces pinistramenti TaxID=2884812 RepID=UPI001D08FA39|nr:RICIN domain-containing protein [Streptomyces pinistramenti]MCB5912327.1 RICIN domain-containing protein [Streptomyces pinistramenti]